MKYRITTDKTRAARVLRELASARSLWGAGAGGLDLAMIARRADISEDEARVMLEMWIAMGAVEKCEP